MRVTGVRLAFVAAAFAHALFDELCHDLFPAHFRSQYPRLVAATKEVDRAKSQSGPPGGAGSTVSSEPLLRKRSRSKSGMRT